MARVIKRRETNYEKKAAAAKLQSEDHEAVDSKAVFFIFMILAGLVYKLLTTQLAK